MKTALWAPSDFGALGALVKEAKSGALGIVTCNHVIAWNGLVSPGSPIQVATRDEMVSDEPYAVARLVNWIHLEHDADNLGDCAYATFERDYPSAQSFGALDPVSGQTGDPAIGDQVVRIGGTVAGYVADVSATIDVDYEFGTFRLVNQIVIQAHPASGSPPRAIPAPSYCATPARSAFRLRWSGVDAAI
jgi:hypothetical protein